jgi:hypothetical protein
LVGDVSMPFAESPSNFPRSPGINYLDCFIQR